MSVASMISFTEDSSLNELKIMMDKMYKAGAKGILLLTCIDNNYPLNEVNEILQKCKLPLCGGAFPKIIFKNKSYAKGAIVLGLMIEPIVVNYSISNKSDADFKQEIHRKSKEIEHLQNFIIISDALCSTSENFIDYFYDYIGSGITTIGGGAGSLDFLPYPVIYTNQGLLGETTQVIALPYQLSNSIAHGWDIMNGPYLVTSSEAHCIHTLDYKPAFDVYKEIIESYNNTPLLIDSFFELAKGYPLGISNLDGEILVRDLIQTDGFSIKSVGNIPINSMLYVLHSDKEKVISASAELAQELCKKPIGNTFLLFNCIGRELFLGDSITDELNAIQSTFPETTLVGVMALGEIANTKNGSIRLLNKTTVLGSF